MDFKTTFVNGFMERRVVYDVLEGFVNPKGATKCASSSDPSMDWCKHLRVGIYALMR